MEINTKYLHLLTLCHNMTIPKQTNFELHTVLLRNNLTLRPRSERIPYAFRTRSKCVPNTVGMRSRGNLETCSPLWLKTVFSTLAKNRVLASENPDTE